MKQYPHTTPRSSLIGLAAAAATVATMAVAIVLPATVTVQPGVDTAVVAAPELKPAQIVELDRVEVVASRPASVHKAATDAAVKSRG